MMRVVTVFNVDDVVVGGLSPFKLSWRRIALTNPLRQPRHLRGQTAITLIV